MRDPASTTTVPRARLRLVGPPGALVRADSPDNTAFDEGTGSLTGRESLEELEAQELRLLALGTGEHLPIELRGKVDELRRRKAALLGRPPA